MAQSRLKVTELDFDTIKTNLKNFLRQQSTFQDYDFEGSGLNVLIDLLAYNTHYNAYYLNMVANEAFLDTALLRDSVVSHAKILGYTPYSVTAPTAVVNLEVPTLSSSAGTLTIPKGFSFISNTIDGQAYDFVVMNEIISTKTDSTYYFENVNIKEGQLVTYTFNYNQSSNPKSLFELRDTNIDTSTITVSVRTNSANSETTVYTKATDSLDVDSNTAVFFLQETRNLRYQIYFGNDIIGKKILDGSSVDVTYLITNGTEANKANNFIAAETLTDSLGESLTNITVNSISAAAGGANRETVDQIKFAAPLQFATQNRLVTKKDYESYIQRSYPSVDSLSVWGGEDENPPIYGKVFVSLKPKENFYISETEKQRIVDEIIKPKSILSITTEIRDPEYLYLILTNNIKYDPAKTSLSVNALTSAIRTSIVSYKNTFLNKFNTIFSLSKLQEQIDNVDLSAILGSETSVRLQKRFTPILGTSSNYTLNFGTVLKRGTITNKLTSTEFISLDSTGTSRTTLIEEVPDSSTGISGIEIVNAGYNYDTAPTVTISGDGSGATATAIVVAGRVTEIKITNRGTDYTRATVSISGGGGFSATAVAVIDASTGTLRTIYFDENANRRIISPSIGTINYTTGVLQLNDLNIQSVATTDGLVRFTVEADENIIQSTRNTIVTIDENDPTSIVTTLERIAS